VKAVIHPLEMNGTAGYPVLEYIDPDGSKSSKEVS
jgi:hypothetical protein